MSFSISNLNIDNLQFNNMSDIQGLDFNQTSNAFKLDSAEPVLDNVTQRADDTSTLLQDFSRFLDEARSILDGLQGNTGGVTGPNSGSLPDSSTSTLPDSTAGGPPVDSSTAGGPPVDSSTAGGSPVDTGETTWSVDRDNNIIKLDDGYQIKLNEGNSEMLLEKLNDAGEVEKSTKIWGDPHLDAGNDGTNDADFWKDSTLALENGTKITIGTREQDGTNMTFADTLTITKDNQALEVSGLMQGADGLQIGEVSQNGVELDAATNDGHVLMEGQGNNWDMQDGTVIGQDAEYTEFAQDEIQNEVRFGTGWFDDPETVAARGDTAATGEPGAMSDDMAAFLDEQGIPYNDADGDGVLDENAWSEIVDGLQGGMDGLGDQGQMLMQILQQLMQMLQQFLQSFSPQEG